MCQRSQLHFLKIGRAETLNFIEEQWRAIFPNNTSVIWVNDEEKGTSQRIDFRTAAVYIGCFANDWSTILDQYTMLCVWVEDWSSAAVFQYLLEIIESDQPGYLPRWHVFCEDNREVPGSLKWRKPSTMWYNWPVTAVVAKTDFMNNGAGTRPSKVGWRDIPPMWTVPSQLFRDIHENITFGLNVERWHK